ncbi:MAG: hypothetical protein CENE_02950 [Candidatus Celerinatantimonas neptuna]|nr:MAG: hypothetical protein CENE_02950 [Candidatus Celerinatantimonas neptuna]
MFTADDKLPRLRQELTLNRSQLINGRPGWQIYDPVQHRYFLIDAADLALLNHPDCHTIGELKEKLAKDHQSVSDTHLTEVLKFIVQQQLCYAPEQHHAKWHLKNLLKQPQIFQLPIWDPKPLLKLIRPVLKESHGLWWGWGLITIVGLYLVARQWDSFLLTFTQFTSVSSLITFALALIGLKIFHEIGHAYMAYSLGCYVGKIGIAIFMGIPMFYTELTDSARVANNRQRMWIAAGGVLTEMLIAGMATFLWAILPEGILRSVCFVIATTAWVVSIIININPLARFDGYYFVSDAFNIANLHPRSLALSRYWLRRLIWGKRTLPPPESLKPLRAKLMTGYGILVWCYRVALLTGIGYFAYRLFTPTIGILIFAYMLAHSLVIPMIKLVKDSYHLSRNASGKRKLVLAILTIALLTLFLFPFNRSTLIPALMSWQHQISIHVPADAKLTRIYVKKDGHIQAGQLLFSFRSPKLEQQIKETNLRINLLTKRVNRIGSSIEEREATQSLKRQLIQAKADLKGLRERQKQLQWRSPETAYLTDIPPNLAVGQWFRPDQTLGRLLIGHKQQLTAYIDESLLERVPSGISGTFIPDNLAIPSMKTDAIFIDTTASTSITPYELASSFGGPLPTRLNKNQRPEPIIAMHRIRTQIMPGKTIEHQAQLGVIDIPLQPRSLAGLARDKLWRVFVQELGQ